MQQQQGIAFIAQAPQQWHKQRLHGHLQRCAVPPHLYTLVRRSCCRCTSSTMLRKPSSCVSSCNRMGNSLQGPENDGAGARRRFEQLTLNAGRLSAGHCATSCSNSYACLPNMVPEGCPAKHSHGQVRSGAGGQGAQASRVC